MTTAFPTTTFTLRAATLDDVEATAQLANRAAQADYGADEMTASLLHHEWTNPQMNLATDTRVAIAPDGQLVGCVEVWYSEPFVRHWIWGRTDPDCGGQGIGSALMAWAEARAHELIPLAPPEARVVISAATTNNDAASALLVERGFELVRHGWTMERPLDQLPAPHWPASIRLITAAELDDYRAIYAAQRDAFRDHWGFVEVANEEEAFARWFHQMQDERFDPSLWFVAMDGDQIAGISICESFHPEDEGLGWVAILGVCRPWRKQGLGLALLYHSFAELQARGKARVGLSVDASNPTGATRLYERAGMRVIRQRDQFIKELRPGVELTNQG